MAHRDIEQSELAELSWLESDRLESLSAVYDHAVNFAKDVEGWYAEKRSAKRPWGRGLRVGAIVLAGLAAVLPVISEISSDGKATIPAGWATVALAVAAVLIALDRFFGFSSGWMRFMLTDLDVKHLRRDFEYAWQAARVELADPPSDEEVAALLKLAHDLGTGVDEAVEKETKEWALEFSSIIEKTERSVVRSDQS